MNILSLLIIIFNYIFHIFILFLKKTMVDIARNAFASRNYRLAAEMYERCLRDNQNSLDIQFGYADSLARSGNFRDALDVYSFCYQQKSVSADNLRHIVSALIDAILGVNNSGNTYRAPNNLKYNTTTTNNSNCNAFSCIICEDILCQPVTLLCGHTSCKQCDLKEKSKCCKRCGQPKNQQYNLEINVLIKNLTEKLWPHLLQASKLKEEGNELFKNDNLDGALQKYNEALELAPSSATVLSNRSHVFLRLARSQAALQDADLAIKLCPVWGKAQYRRAMALAALGRHEESLHALACCVVLDRNPHVVHQEIASVLHALLSPRPRNGHRSSQNGHRISSPVQKPYWRLKRNNMSPTAVGFVSSRRYSDCEEDSSGDEEPQVSRSSSVEIQRNSRLRGTIDRLFRAIDRIQRTPETGEEEKNTLIAQAVTQTIEPNDLDCVLCCRLLWRPVTTPCGHTYCWTCLDRCLDYSHACPLCMAPLADFLASSQRNVTEFVERITRTLLPEELSARQAQQEALDTSVGESRVPIFVCTTTFPTVACPLFVYEPRYRLMIRRAVESGQRQFGITALVDQQATGHRRYSEFGTMLEIRDQVCLASGCSILTTIGFRRFRVVEGGESDGYDLAKVDFLVDEPVSEDALPGVIELHNLTRLKAKIWLTTLSNVTKLEISRSFGEMPSLEDDWVNVSDGPSWTWWLLSVLPLGPKLKIGILGTTSLEKRLRAIDKTLNYLAKQRADSNEKSEEVSTEEETCHTRL